MYVVYTYQTLPSGELDCHIYSGEPNVASWTLQEAQMELAAMQAKNASLGGMVLPIELAAATE